jgi:hypothetical protein
MAPAEVDDSGREELLWSLPRLQAAVKAAKRAKEPFRSSVRRSLDILRR